MEKKPEITVAQMMCARDKRAEHQRRLLEKWQASLCCLTLNIAGPVKSAPWIDEVFEEGTSLAEAQFRRLGMKVLAREQVLAVTGNEMYWVVDAPVLTVKRAMVRIEEANPFGRLLDLDVLARTGEKAEREEIGAESRRCLLCEERAVICARSRTHSYEELFSTARATANRYFQAKQADRIAGLAVQSLLHELLITPKPGLVDRENCGSHEDMDCFLFASSAAALIPYFRACVLEGMCFSSAEPKTVFPRLKYLGMEAEEDMLRMTAGVNTHKGAIFSIGLLCAGAGRLWAKQKPLLAEEICQMAALMAGDALRDDLQKIDQTTAKTAGERIYAKIGLGGARGEAAAGFPSVLQKGLPALEKALAEGVSLNEAGIYALLALMSVTEDTNVIRRGSLKQQQEVACQAAELLQEQPVSLEVVRMFDRHLISQRLSPGGAADLLAATLFLHSLRPIY